MGKGTSSLYRRAVIGFLFKDWLLLQRSQSVMLITSKLDVLEILSWCSEDTTSTVAQQVLNRPD